VPDEATIRREEIRQTSKLKKKWQKLQNKLKNNVENIVRQEFGFKKIGEGWVS
jgi:hypothetical protein